MSSRFSSAMAGLLIVLLAAFFILTVRNMVEVNERVDAMENGPYVVAVEAGKVETRLVQLDTLAKQLVYARTKEAIDNVESSYATIDEEVQESLSVILDHHIDKDISAALARSYDELLALQGEYIDLCRNPETFDAEVRSFAEEKINPKINDLLDVNTRVLEESANQVESICVDVDEIGRQNIIMASMLMAVLVASLIDYMVMIRCNNRKRMQLKESLREALAQAQNANKAKSQFLSSMSHDIRTPLNAIVGLTAIADSHIDDPHRVRECLSRIQVSSHHLLELINDILDMNKIESGKIELNEEQFSLPDFINGIITIIQPHARAKNLNLDVVIGNVRQETVIGDELRLNQAILNILGNAVKYTPDGGSIRLIMSEEESEKAGSCNYRFVVHDTGIGMTPEFIEKIFEPFERERTATTYHTDGVGLGMPITKNLIDLMEGGIQVESVLGEGTVVTIVVPLKAANEEGKEIDLTAFRNAPILVVDDDPDVLKNTQLILNEIGLKVVTVASGNEAIVRAASAYDTNDNFRAIIMDWTMPGMDGIETIKQIQRKIGEKTPPILLTAYDWSEVEDEARTAGATAFILKPLFKSRLCHALNSLCNDEIEVDTVKEKQESKEIHGRVLLVEDNSLNRQIATELMQDFGVEVEQACDGIEAINMVKSAPDAYYDLVFMDIRMPHMGGLEATRRICEFMHEAKRSRPPIVAMTANAFNEDKRAALEAGMDGFMAKPIDINELKMHLRTYLR